MSRFMKEYVADAHPFFLVMTVVTAAWGVFMVGVTIYLIWGR